MMFSSSLLALPMSLLLLLANGHLAQAAQDDQSPAPRSYDVPRDAKGWPEDPPNRRRDVEAIKHLIREGAQPVGVRKMSADPDEKFYPEYWGFGDQEMEQAILGVGSGWALRQDYHEEEEEDHSNGSVSLSFRPPFPFHSEKEDSLSRRIVDTARDWLTGRDSEGTLAILKKRGFECVTGTSPCSLIHKPNLCCALTETCYPIPDTGLGTVGCCPAGASCGGSISCASGNTPCLVNNTGGYTGGGCCIPGYVCAGVGCIPSVSLSTSTQTTVISASATVIVVTKTTTPSVTPTTSTVTKTNTATQTSVTPTTKTTTPTTTTATATSTSLTSAAGVVPNRGTSASDSSTSTNSICPTGFYACSATYRGGCCQTDRDCNTHNCPPQASTTIVSSGQTIVVPLTPSATTTASGHCATGWTTCAASLGGACCPNNWTCGTVSCFSSTGPSQSASQPKEGVVLGAAGRARGNASRMAWIASLGFIVMIAI